MELLWYSQLPCFDVVNVTTKVNEEFGNINYRLETCYGKFKIGSHKIDFSARIRNLSTNITWHCLFQGMIKKCFWKGRRLSCSSIFTMHPSDRGMCCSFNKKKADEMFKQNRYQENMKFLTDQDKKLSREDSIVPPW